MATFNVKGCARCGQDHVDLDFKEFSRPIVDSDGTVWSQWAICPTTGEPVLWGKPGKAEAKTGTGPLGSVQTHGPQ
jgi:hypothetical protein